MLDCCNEKYVNYLRELKTNEISQVEVDKLFDLIKDKQMEYNAIKLRIMESVFSNAMRTPDTSGIHDMQDNNEINKTENQMNKNCIII